MSNTLDATARPFALDEVQAAVRALRAGEFRNARPTARPADPAAPDPSSDRGTGRQPARAGYRGPLAVAAADWRPQAGERVLAVVGSSGSSGASTVALAVALSARMPARVVECCSASASGLAAATTAELGLHPAGWRRGRREQVLIERVSTILSGVDEVPAPTTFGPGAVRTSRLTVLDIAWEVGQLTTTDSWVADAVTDCDQLILATTATVPGIRRLEGALDLLTTRTGIRVDAIWLAVLGPRRRKWPRGLQHAGGPRTRRALNSERVLEVPVDRGLLIHGLDSRPMPPSLLAAAARAHAAAGSADEHHLQNEAERELVDPVDQLHLFGDAEFTDLPQ